VVDHSGNQGGLGDTLGWKSAQQAHAATDALHGPRTAVPRWVLRLTRQLLLLLLLQQQGMAHSKERWGLNSRQALRIEDP